MVKLAIICEGKSERLFSESLLKSHLANFDVDVSAIEVGIENKQPGGNVTFARIMNDAKILLNDHDHVTTLIDFFRLGSGWSGNERIVSDMTSSEQAVAVEDAALQDSEEELGDLSSRFIPNVLMHEFEALLFTDPKAIVDVTHASASLDGLMKVVSEFPSPEDINTGRVTAPSKRLASLKTNYGKIAHGLRIISKIGIPAIRSKCPHFNSWLAKVELLSKK